MATERQIIEALMAGVDLDRLSPLPGRPAWWAGAACRVHPEVNFFPGKGESSSAAREVCSGCASKAECLAFALAEHIDHGTWGGLTAKERRAIRPKSTAPRAPVVQVSKWDRVERNRRAAG
jgi:WhiB family redox-sensing transcriptional regulator